MAVALSETEIAEAFHIIRQFVPKQRSFITPASGSPRNKNLADTLSFTATGGGARASGSHHHTHHDDELTLSQLLAFVRGTSFNQQAEYTDSLVSKIFHATTQRSQLTLPELIQAASSTALHGSLNLSTSTTAIDALGAPASGRHKARQGEVSFAGNQNAAAAKNNNNPSLTAQPAPYANDWQILLRRAIANDKMHRQSAINAGKMWNKSTPETSPRRQAQQQDQTVKLPQLIQTLKSQRAEVRPSPVQGSIATHPTWSVHAKLSPRSKDAANNATAAATPSRHSVNSSSGTVNRSLEQLPSNETEDYRDPFDALRVNKDGTSLKQARRQQETEWLHKRQQVQPDSNGAVVIPSSPRNGGAPVVIVDATTEQKKAADAKRKQEEICRMLAVKFGAPEGAVKVSKGAAQTQPLSPEEALRERQLYVNTMTNIVGFLSSPR